MSSRRRSTVLSPSTSHAASTTRRRSWSGSRGRSCGETRLLGVSELDLFVPVLTFVFGEAQLQGPCALISLHRLREEFYGLPARPDLLLERAIKEAVHELGHTFGLRHCPNWSCVMASTHAVERLDLKSAEFCASCARVALPA